MPVGKEIGFKLVLGDPNRAIIVERCADDADPDYCVHGKTQCDKCREWCWLGDNSFEMVCAGKATPLCVVCATELNAITPTTYLGVVHDTRHPHA